MGVRFGEEICSVQHPIGCDDLHRLHVIVMCSQTEEYRWISQGIVAE